MKILFWLYRSQKNGKGLMPVMMRITIDGQRINFPVDISIEEKNWNKDKQQIRATHELALNYNQHLMHLKAKAWEYYNDSRKVDKSITAKDVRNYVTGKDNTTRTLIEALDYHISQMKSRVGNDVAPATIKNYEMSKRKIAAFLKQEKRVDDVFLNQLNHQFIQEFDVFMRVKGLHNNGVIKVMQQLKRVIRVAMLNEWLSKDPFAHYKCKLVEPKRVHLTKEELAIVENLVLPTERLEKVRDVFVFACYTGLAYVDMAKLSVHHFHEINGKKWIILSRTKTNNQSTIPLFPEAEKILERYKSRSSVGLPVISSQNMNKYLKEIAGLAGIPKRLTCHAARHTFATSVTLNSGVDIVSVSAMLGHKMLRTTQIYARVDMNKIAADVAGLLERG